MIHRYKELSLIILCCIIYGDASTSGNFYEHEVVDITGNKVQLKKYIGKVTLVVTVASECGFTDKHYKGMVRMKSILGLDNRFEILAFPCNQFGAQEPKGDAEIFKWATDTYDINFDMFSKINVLPPDVPSAFQYLISATGQIPQWNFWKFLVGPNGKVINAWGPWSDIDELFPIVKKTVDDAISGKPQPPSTSGAPGEDLRAEDGEARAPADSYVREPSGPPTHDDL